MGGIVLITTYQSATINPGERCRQASKAQKLAANRAAFFSAVSPYTLVYRAPNGPSTAPPCGAHTNAIGVNDSQYTTPRTPTSAHANTTLSSIIIHHHMVNFATQMTRVAAKLQSAHNVIDSIIGKS
jgi:hypothetical protein